MMTLGDSISDLQRLDAAVRLARRSRIGRIVASPLRGGYARALEAYCRALGTSVRTRARTFWGDPFTAVLPERLSVCVARYGFFEHELTRTMLRMVKPDMTVFDVGAHFGYYSSLAAHLVGSAGQVHSFEPTTSTFDILKANVGWKPNVRLNNLALYREETVLTFKDFGVEQSMFNTLYGARTTEASRAQIGEPKLIEVQATTCDSYCQRTGAAPDFIKIDAEGAEPDVLAGMKQTLRSMRPVLTLEVGDWGVAGMMPSREVVGLLLDEGYTPLEYRDGQLVPHAVRQDYGYENLVFVPK